MEYLTTIDLPTFERFLYVWIAAAILSALPLFIGKFMPISGKVQNKSFAILGQVDKKLAWIIMEVPILISVIGFYLLGKNPANVSIIMVIVFCIHYGNRALIYPHRIKADGKTMPAMMMIFSMLFYIVNGYMIGYYFGALRSYDIHWLTDPRFIIGFVLFFVGFYINVTSDNILINLRKPGETGYKIPQGGMFRYVSCPHYLGEIIEWLSFALMSWSLPAVAYALWVVLPLYAQGLSAHQWYLDKFGPDYPASRKAIIPFIR